MLAENVKSVKHMAFAEREIDSALEHAKANGASLRM